MNGNNILFMRVRVKIANHSKGKKVVSLTHTYASGGRHKFPVDKRFISDPTWSNSRDDFIKNNLNEIESLCEWYIKEVKPLHPLAFYDSKMLSLREKEQDLERRCVDHLKACMPECFI